ncbi:hypothetical protein LSTR_LSTR001246 [Laodelphax striatellus]|uniref:Protein-cysteine N-palmitoyltransferase Rasp n=1 Tax=Laodelphax striatellus TaxID=195883 RepID=A0A482XC75_LAOST|nr:hypothetical protein LSTR_LSTR001246 [Laodelphax striatellus]
MLSKTELYFNGFLWLSALLYASYHVYEAGKYFEFSDYAEDFEDGWIWNLKKDCADYEWQTWLKLLKNIYPWFLVHLVASEITRWTFLEAVPICNFVTTVLVILNILGPEICLIFIGQVCLYYLALQIRSTVVIWILSVLLLYTIYGFKYGLSYLLVSIGLPDYTLYNNTAVLSAWILLKCISFCLDHINAKKSTENNFDVFITLLGYTFYLPLFFLGPFMMYEDYEKGVRLPFQKWGRQRLRNLVFNILRYTFWMIVLDIFLHFFYIHAFEYKLDQLKEMGAWYLNGVVYYLALFFYIKYLAIYGLTGTLARAENYNAPPPPACVCYMYCDSQLWRSFDIGFYLFMKRYIYEPVLGENKTFCRRLFASGVTFCYVFLWHGFSENIFLWSLLNFIELSLESIMRYISKIYKFQIWVNNTFSENNQKRLLAICFAPFSIFGIHFNAYMYSPGEGGGVINSQFLEGNWLFNFIFIILAYNFCITAMEISRRKQRKHLISTKHH